MSLLNKKNRSIELIQEKNITLPVYGNKLSIHFCPLGSFKILSGVNILNKTLMMI